MAKRALGALCALAIATPLSAEAGDEAAAKLRRARDAYNSAEFEEARRWLEAAELAATEPAELGAIYLQAGLVEEVLQRPDLALLYFLRAFRCDLGTELSLAQHKDSVARLYTLAVALHRSNADVGLVERNRGDRSRIDLCPVTSLAPRAASPVAASPVAPVAVGPHWSVYALGGAAVAALSAGAAVGFLARSKDEECVGLVEPGAYADCDAAASSLELGANAAFVGAGAFALGALLAWVWADVPLTGAVSVAPSGAAIGLSGRF